MTQCLCHSHGDIEPKAGSAPFATEQRAAEAARLPSPILEGKRIKVTAIDKPSFIKGISIRCNRWVCPSCRRVKGIHLREKLLDRAELFKVPRLFTITINRDWFKSPHDAYDWVMKKKFIARLLTQKMGISRWFWVLEAQENSGDGWPHWHIMLDISDLPGKWYNSYTKTFQNATPENKTGWVFIRHFFDLERVHYYLRKWKIGEQCRFSSRKDDFESSAHAVRYITKYLIKEPEKGNPHWILKNSGIRFYQPSRGIGGLSADDVELDNTHEKRSYSPPRIPVDAAAECGLKTFFLQYSESRDTNLFSRSGWGYKNHIPAFSGGVTLPDFSFDTKKEFQIFGFVNWDTCFRFIEFNKTESCQSLFKDQIRIRKDSLLSKWIPESQGADGVSEVRASRLNTGILPEEVLTGHLAESGNLSKAKGQTQAETAGLREGCLSSPNVSPQAKNSPPGARLDRDCLPMSGENFLWPDWAKLSKQDRTYQI